MLPNNRVHRRAATVRGFTLAEILVAMAVLVLILVMLLGMVNQTTSLWRSTLGETQEFQRARAAFEILTTRLSRATLNTYWGYYTPVSGGPPTQYIRQSELRFISGQCSTLVGGTPATNPTHAVFFQAPGGVSLSGSVSDPPGALSTWGYFIQYGNDSSYRPSVLSGLPARYRFRLFELMEPTDQLTIYNYTSGVNGSGIAKCLSYVGHDWFQTAIALGSARMRILAENVVALVILPKLSASDDVSGVYLSPSYTYDSTATSNGTPSPVPPLPSPAPTAGMTDPHNQLPPAVEVTMVVVEENPHIAWGATPPNLGMSTLFQNATNQTADLTTLENTLRGLGLHPHHFSLTVALPASKWSTNQTD